MSNKLIAKIKTHKHVDDGSIFSLDDSTFNTMVDSGRGLLYQLAYGDSFYPEAIGMDENGLDAIISLIAGRNYNEEKFKQLNDLVYEMYYDNVGRNFYWEDDELTDEDISIRMTVEEFLKNYNYNSEYIEINIHMFKDTTKAKVYTFKSKEESQEVINDFGNADIKRISYFNNNIFIEALEHDPAKDTLSNNINLDNVINPF